MPKELISQEELEEVCPYMVEELELIINESATFKEAEEATIYAISQLLLNRIGAIDMTGEDKGAIVATIIQGLCDFNSDVLAAHRERVRLLIEKKTSTIH